MMKLIVDNVTQIGIIHSPYREKREAPFQGRHENAECSIEIFKEYEDALLDIETCSHLYVLYWQHLSNKEVLQTKTPWGPDIHGIFATRSPNRPNPIGLCIVELLERKGRFLGVNGMDALDGSPLIDIKPYSSSIDSIQNARIGWRET